MKIIISLPNMFWSLKMEYFQNCIKDIIIIQFDDMKNEERTTTIDARIPVFGLGQTSGPVRGGQTYNQIKNQLNLIFDKITYGEDILVLADTNPDNVIIFDLLKTKTDGKNFRLHFWGIFPFKFESKIRKNWYFDLLEGYGRAVSLCIKPADEYLEIVNYRTTLPQLFDIIKNDLEIRFPHIVEEIKDFNPHRTYFFDNLTEEFKDAVQMKNNDMFRQRKETRQDAIEYTCSASDKELIEKPDLHYNGKDICRKLRLLRQKFAEANGISFESCECDYEGSCAGTCAQCDSELTYLADKLSMIAKEKRVFPYSETEINTVSIEQSCDNLGSNGSMMVSGYLKKRIYQGKNNKMAEVQIPNYLMNHKGGDLEK